MPPSSVPNNRLRLPAWLTSPKFKAGLLALLELTITWLISNIPLAMLAFIISLTTPNDQLSFAMIYDRVTKHIHAGGVFAYLCVLLAPVLWTMFANWRARKHVGYFLTLIAIQMCVLLVTGIMFALYNVHLNINGNIVFYTATFSYCIVLLIWFATAFMRRAYLDEPTLLASESTGSKSMSQLLQEHDHGH